MNIYSLPPLIAVLLTLFFVLLLNKHSRSKELTVIGNMYSFFIIWWQLGYAYLFPLKRKCHDCVTQLLFLTPTVNRSLMKIHFANVHEKTSVNG